MGAIHKTTPLGWAMVAGSLAASGVRGLLDGWPGLGIAFVALGFAVGAVAGVLQYRVARAAREEEGA